MDLKDIVFISPVNKGEKFTFKQLLNVDENQKLFEKETQQLINDYKNTASVILKEKLESESFKKLKSLEESMKKDLTSEFKSEITRLQTELLNIEKINDKLFKSKDDQILKADKQVNELQKTLKIITDKLQQNFNKSLAVETSRIQEEYTKKENELKTQLKKTANQIGDEGEDFVRDKLQQTFETDKIIKPNHAIGGADVEQTIIDNDKKIGSIYFEVKNKKTWSYADYENFANKVRSRDDDLNIYVAKTMPKSTKEKHLSKVNESLYFDKTSNVYLVSFDTFLQVTFALRNLLIKFKRELNKQDDIKTIQEKVYDFISSEEFNNYFAIIKTNVRELELVFKNIQTQTTKGLGESKNIEIQVNNLIEILDRKKN